MAFRKIYDKDKIQDAVFKSEMEHKKELAKALKKFGIDYKPERFDKFGMTKAKKVAKIQKTTTKL